MVVFFLSSMVIVLLLSFGFVGQDGNPYFGHTLDNYQALWSTTYLKLFVGRWSMPCSPSCSPR